jgi:hypothetical protein
MTGYIPPGFTEVPKNNVWPAEEKEEAVFKLLRF